jgi:hypothetical protein
MRIVYLIFLIVIATLLVNCHPEYIESFVASQKYSKQHNLPQKTKEKTRLLRQGWRNYNHGKYNRALLKVQKASEISTAGRVQAEPTELAYSTTLLMAQCYFQLHKYNAALSAIEEYDNGYFNDQQHYTLDSLQMKILAKKLGCDSLYSEINISLDSVRKVDYAKSAYCFVIPLKNCKQDVVLHPTSADYYFVMGPYDNPWKMNPERAARFKTYFLNSDLYKLACD